MSLSGSGGQVRPAPRLSADERRAYVSGRRHFERGDVDSALAAFGRLLETRGGFADVHYMVGVLHERRNDHEAAARSLRRALRINPSYAEALLALAGVYEQLGDFERSREIARRAIQPARPPGGGAGPSAGPELDATTRGKLANLQAGLGDAFVEVGELGEAIGCYRRALDRCPHFYDIRQRLAVALRDAGLPDQALSELRRILRAHPGYLDAAVQLGLTLYTLGRSDEAVATWRAVLDRQPDREDADMYLRLVKPIGDGS